MPEGKPEFVGPAGGIKLPRPPRPPRRVTGCLVAAGLLLAVLSGPYFAFLDYVGPNEYGIMEVQMGVNRGIQPEVYPPGYTLVIPFAQILHKLPRAVQVLELTMVPDDYVRGTAAFPSDSVYHDRAAKIQTSDGFFVDVDVSILYRITDAHKAFLEYGGGQGYLMNGVLPRAEPVLKQALGELTTEEFYKAPLRSEVTEKARQLLNLELETHGISVEQVLVRYFKYTDRIQENIEAKKLQDQLVFTNQSKRKAAEADQVLKRVEAEGKMKVSVTLEEGKAYKVKKEAEKDLYVRSRRAEADLLEQLAEAESTRMRNEVMQTAGSDRYVAMQMAGVLNGLEFILLPTGADSNLIPLDLNRMLGVLGVNVGEAAAASVSEANPRIEELKRDAEASAEAARQEIANPAPSLMEKIVTEGEVVQ
jgi:regulator of protease activity HflC (stomatin/prohibitin superfamily)